MKNALLVVAALFAVAAYAGLSGGGLTGGGQTSSIVAACPDGGDCYYRTLRVTQPDSGVAIELQDEGKIDFGSGDYDWIRSDGWWLEVGEGSGGLGTESASGIMAGTVQGDYILPQSAINMGSGTKIHSDSSGYPVVINDAEGLGLQGVATGSLAVCNSTAPQSGGRRGTLQYDTTTSQARLCDGSAWRAVGYTEARVSAYLGVNVNGADRVFGATVATGRYNRVRVQFVVAIAGSGAAATGTLEVFNVTDGTTLATLTYNCPDAAGTVTSLAETTVTTVDPGDVIGIGFGNTEACSTQPFGTATVLFYEAGP